MRRAEVVLPSCFDDPELGQQARIARKLLVHDPKLRVSAAELLRSDLLPARLEDETVTDAIRSLSNPNTPYYGKLINALFSHLMDRHKDFAYDFHSVPARPFDFRATPTIP